MRIKQVEARTGLHRSQIYAWMKEGHFPQSIKTGPASVAWLGNEIDKGIENTLRLRALRPSHKSNNNE
ncbi:AlpA family phage regulatory protein [Cronobacter muytjensii]|uniref:AlpA family phage regulatory protein n=1 Tax=Cronobacter muytjensii TaxID=413501 RepID=UPI0020CA55B0|nr:AlpA family phage regulatory protein [Cronobacter muytjensii]